MTKEGMNKEETDSFRRIERFHGHMSRIVSLPDNVDASAVDATVTNGVLHVTIPKKEGEKEKKIEIK
jgi:HSP20 family protein